MPGYTQPNTKNAIMIPSKQLHLPPLPRIPNTLPLHNPNIPHPHNNPKILLTPITGHHNRHSRPQTPDKNHLPQFWSLDHTSSTGIII